MSRHRTIVLAVATLVAVACGGAGEDTTPDPVAEDTTPASTTPAGEPAGEDAAGDEAAATTVAVTTSQLGDILVDGAGMVLYLFTPDEAGESTCTDACAENWPPLQGPADAGDGVDAALLGNVTRADGSEQVTYDGWPLYHFAGDDAPGDTNGQGVNDVWFVVDPSGAAVEAMADSETDTEAGGY